MMRLSPQFGVFRFSLLKNRDVGVGVLPQCQMCTKRIYFAISLRKTSSEEFATGRDTSNPRLSSTRPEIL